SRPLVLYYLSFSFRSLTCVIRNERLSTSLYFSALSSSFNLSSDNVLKNEIIIMTNIANSGTLANKEAVFKTSNARSPPTNINPNGNRHNAKAQYNLLAFNGSPITFFREAAAKIYEPESNVVAKNKNADNKNSTMIKLGNGN